MTKQKKEKTSKRQNRQIYTDKKESSIFGCQGTFALLKYFYFSGENWQDEDDVDLGGFYICTDGDI